jgi:hypothetical protein
VKYSAELAAHVPARSSTSTNHERESVTTARASSRHDSAFDAAARVRKAVDGAFDT